MADENKYTFSGQTGAEEPKPKDVDLDHDSPHHTLGRGPLQAAPGKHTHSASEIPDLPTGAAPHDHTGVYAPEVHNHAAVTNADTVDNQHLNWDDRGHVPTYVWGVTNYGDSFLVWTGRFSQPGHTHDYAASSHGHGYGYSNTRTGSVVVACNIAGSVYFGVGAFGGAPVIVNGDWGAANVHVRLLSWDGSGISAGGFAANATVRINYVVN